jgi:hypothetical protein
MHITVPYVYYPVRHIHSAAGYFKVWQLDPPAETLVRVFLLLHLFGQPRTELVYAPPKRKTPLSNLPINRFVSDILDGPSSTRRSFTWVPVREIVGFYSERNVAVEDPLAIHSTSLSVRPRCPQTISGDITHQSGRSRVDLIRERLLALWAFRRLSAHFVC